MSTTTNQPHAFVIRIWPETMSKCGDHEEWRGHITDLASLERRYFTDPGDIIGFLNDQLKGHDVETGWVSRVPTTEQ